ncbi:AIM24 family protein, partial [Vibrio splendidus]
MNINTSKKNRTCHEIEIEVHGEVMSHCTVTLDQGETVVAEAGALLSYDEGIVSETKFGDGSSGTGGKGFFGGLVSAASRAISGESVFLTHFTNKNAQRKTVKLSATVPGAMCVIDMG